MLKRILSYIFPITLSRQSSPISGQLTVTLLSGKRLLNTPNTDYSFGSLQRILRFGLQKIGFERIQKQKNVLVLGLAAGSVVETLVEEVQFRGQIHGVDIDPEVIAIGRQYFHLDKIKNLQIFLCDAQDYIKTTRVKYDLVIVDIFQDDQMPAFLFAPAFFSQLKEILNKKGVILFNTIVKTKAEAQRNKNFIEFFSDQYYIDRYPKVEGENEIFILEGKNKR